MRLAGGWQLGVPAAELRLRALHLHARLLRLIVACFASSRLPNIMTPNIPLCLCRRWWATACWWPPTAPGTCQVGASRSLLACCSAAFCRLVAGISL